jgi:hypothetical protein
MHSTLFQYAIHGQGSVVGQPSGWTSAGRPQRQGAGGLLGCLFG